ncbi:MAG: tetratricopeptide repeat protein [Treponema sp.]|nr:tetratricopeptide repeat protein [Candidatus Treponema caballi]
MIAKKACAALLIIMFLFCSCSKESESDYTKELSSLLQTELPDESRFSVLNQLSQTMLNENRTDDVILLLTGWVNSHPEDQYNAWWLLMTAQAYLQAGAEPMAELYFERIINNYDDLYIKGKSVHMMCLQNLIRISDDPENTTEYFSRLVSQFPDSVNKTELYARLAVEYEKLGEWNQVLKSWSDFLAQSDAATIQIAGIPNAYSTARNLIDFNNSSKNWTFDSLDALETAVKRAISAYDYNTLEKYRSKVNFFSMSWRQDATQDNSLANFTMRDFMQGQRIRYNDALDDSSTPDEAFLRTWGWSSYVNVWYLYFRKVNFPLDPEINGRWEWAGIYYGEKL